MAETEKVIFEPTIPVAPVGCEVIVGGAITVRLAMALVVEPAELVTTTEYEPA